MSFLPQHDRHPPRRVDGRPSLLLVEPTQQLKVLFWRLPEPDTRIDDDALAWDAGPLENANALLEAGRDVGEKILVFNIGEIAADSVGSGGRSPTISMVAPVASAPASKQRITLSRSAAISSMRVVRTM